MKKFIVATLSAALLAGCGLFWDDPYVTVTVTPLNWVEIHYYNATREPVRRVAVLGGGGEDDIGAAVAAGADTYVTGELKYHHLCDAPYGEINLVMAGHYHTEAPVLGRLAELAEAACPGVPVTVYDACRVEIL